MRTNRFTFLCDDEERRLITAIAKHLKRSQGDAIRFILRTAAQELRLNLNSQVNRQPKGVANG